MRTCGRTGSGGLTKKTEVNRCPDGTRFPPGEMWDSLEDITRIFQISPCGKLVLVIEVTDFEIDGLPFHVPWRCFNIQFRPGSFVLSNLERRQRPVNI